MIQTRKINSLLKTLTSPKSNLPIFVDNLHSPYIQLEKEFAMPAISNFQLSTEEAFNLTEIFSEFIPSLIQNTNLLPEPKPKREHSKLNYVNDFFWKGNSYLYVVKIDIAYLGGSPREKIIKQATQNHYPSYYTDRIYFSTRILPLKEIIYTDNEIIDFIPKNYEKMIYIEEVNHDDKKFPTVFSEVFDEIDYKHLIEPLKLKYGIDNEVWRLGKIYDPLAIEFLTLVVKFLNISQKDSIEQFKKFYEIVEKAYSEFPPSEDSILEFKNWLKLHKSERSLSPSGNVRWQIKQNLTLH